jgi:hypothetical protein
LYWLWSDNDWRSWWVLWSAISSCDISVNDGDEDGSDDDDDATALAATLMLCSPATDANKCLRNAAGYYDLATVPRNSRILI